MAIFTMNPRFDSCPYCQEGAGVGKTVAAGTVGKTVAAVPGGAAPEADRGKTVALLKRRSVLILQ